jgi:signal transduction histidine kinase
LVPRPDETNGVGSDAAAPRWGDCATTDQIEQTADRRAERALVAYVRQELSAPAFAIMGYAEILMDDAVQAGRQQLVGDLQRILDASRNLHRLIISLLDPATIRQTGAGVDLSESRRTLRHDLRTPINAIKGYGEMLREDAADEGADALVADLDKLLGEATLLLDRIDGLVTFSESDIAPSDGTSVAATETSTSEKMVESLLKAVRPVAENEANRAAIQPSRILVVDDNASNRDLLSRRLPAAPGTHGASGRGRCHCPRNSREGGSRSRPARSDDAGHQRL